MIPWIVDGTAMVVHSEAKASSCFAYILDAAFGALNHVNDIA